MRQSLTLVTAPSGEVLTVDDVKQFAKIDTDEDDALIDTFITTARQAAEQYTRRSFVTQTWKVSLDMACSGLDRVLTDGVYDLPVSALFGGLPRTIQLPMPPIATVTSVKTYDTDNTESTFDSSNYTLDAPSGRLILNSTAVWPSNLRNAAAVAVTYTAGYGDNPGDVPKPIHSSILMHAAKMYDERCACDMPDSSRRLLNQYRVIGSHG